MSKWRNATGPAMALACLTLIAACSQYDVFGTRRDIVVDQPAGQSFIAMETTSGKVLATPSGMTLYTFDKDTADSGKSACNGPCAALWPPLMASATDQPRGAYTVITRDDGSRQWAYKGKPVYTYKPDQKAGDRSGDNFRDVWHIIKE